MQVHKTEIQSIDASNPELSVIERAARMVRAGELVVFPTETVYGLGADALNRGAVEKIFAAKGRPLSDPLIVHIADMDALDALVTQVLAEARLLANVFWPGPLTMILPASERVPRLVTAGLETVAIRMPRHPVALALIRATGSPIAAPSANRFMHVSPTTAQHVLSDLAGRVPLILDGGPCEVGVESTVLDVTATPPRILRPGGVSLEALRAVLPEVELPAPRQQSEEIALKSPGQMLMHYAPAVPLLLFEGTAEKMRAAMLEEARLRLARGELIGVLLADEDVTAFVDCDALLYSLGATPEEAAARLFAGMRTLEEAGVQVILSRTVDARGLGLAVRDRLFKAAGGQIYRNV